MVKALSAGLFTVNCVCSFQVKLRNDMPDDMLKDAIETSRRIISEVEDFETQGELEF